MISPVASPGCGIGSCGRLEGRFDCCEDWTARIRREMRMQGEGRPKVEALFEF